MVSASTSIRRAIIVCGLGYFIDLLDIQLFAVLRIPSLTELGVPSDQLATIGSYILNGQFLGMIIGAFLWGWIGDRYGRLKALYGSIILYSLGSLACSLAQDPVSYGVLRFVTGFGLAGETGAGITLVAELMAPHKRGWGVTIVGALAFLGPAVAVLISWFTPWRTTYVLAGLTGFALLILRLKLLEPAMFQKTNRGDNMRGSLRLLFQPKQALTFICCMIIGLPLVYQWNLLNFLSAELSHQMLVPGEEFNQKICLLAFYIGSSLGDVLSGALSQLIGSRRKALAIFFVAGFGIAGSYLMIGPIIHFTALVYYAIYFVLGIAAGGFILFAMVAAEQFGTNIRATTAITITNLVRGLIIPILFIFQKLQAVASITNAAALIGAVLFAAGFVALYHLRETHGLDLDYVEGIAPKAGKI